MYSGKLLTYLIAVVWLANGLFCKVLNLVPRHRQIVARILGEAYATPLTTLIGLAEIGMMVWVLSGLWRRQCGYVQIGVVLLMNVIEFWLARDLLLFGPFNLLIAIGFTGIVYVWSNKLSQH
jgi:uncharacterized membrane protein YphA (DoxX/SURF4 family)